MKTTQGWGTHSLVLFLAALFFATASAHSWVEQLMVIAANGTFVGSPGYARGNVLRTSPGFSDPTMVHLIPPSTRGNEILPSDKMCMDTQQTRNQTNGSPRLQASAGDALALRFQENGHVTLPQNQPGKPKNRGTVYVYGTTDPRDDESFMDVHKKWNKAGTGGDKRGVLLSVQNFDDGRCYQINDGKISTTRQKEFPHQADQLMGADLWCQQDIKLPSNAPSGKPYTLYWVWDWPTEPGVDPSLPKGKQEIYTTCMDVDIVDKSTAKSNAKSGFVKGQSLNSAAIPSQFAQIMAGLISGAPASSSQVPTPTPSMKAQTPSPPSPVRVVVTTSFVTVTRTVSPTPSSCHS